MIEIALAIGGEAIPADAIGRILAAGRPLLGHSVELLDDIAATLDALALRGLGAGDQGRSGPPEAKLAASGLGARFAGGEIVSDKTPATFTRLFARHGVAPDGAVMAGGSRRSDVRPAPAAGAWAAFVPQALAWSHEQVAAPVDHPRFRTIDRLADLPGWIDEIAAA